MSERKGRSIDFYIDICDTPRFPRSIFPLSKHIGPNIHFTQPFTHNLKSSLLLIRIGALKIFWLWRPIYKVCKFKK